MNTISRMRRRARMRGFSHVSTTLEAAAIMGWFALMVISEKHLDDAVTARRASENSAETSAHGSAAAGASQLVQTAVGEAQPTANGAIDTSENLGLGNGSMPSLSAVGIDPTKAFPSQRAPMKSAQVVAKTNGAYAVARSLAAQDPLPVATTPQVAPLRTTLWTEHLMGY